MRIPKGGGFGNAMFSTIQRNAALLNGIGYFDTRKEYLKASKKIRISDPKKATPDQLKQIRVILKEHKRQAFLKKISVMVVAMVLTTILIFGFIYWMRMVFGF